MRHVYIVSDLHFGGAPSRTLADGETLGFQMCPPDSRRRLARFIHRLTAETRSKDIELIINGDFIDFLAEETEARERQDGEHTASFEALSAEPGEAVRKLASAVRRTDEEAAPGDRVFEALRAFLARGHALTLLLGNHDVELSFPQVRRALMDVLTGGGGAARIEFLYDGEACERGALLVEHGNRYDGWNALSHGSLRAYRSAISRGETPPASPPAPPGSRLVAEIMNPLKSRYRFIDLLKPENEALIPVLAALEPDVVAALERVAPRTLVRLYVEQWAAHSAAGQVPRRESYIAAGGEAAGNTSPAAPGRLPDEVLGDAIPPEVVQRTDELLQRARATWLDERPSRTEAQIAFRPGEWLQSGRSLWRLLRLAHADADTRMIRLREAFLQYRSLLASAFDLETEAPQYLEAARRLATGRRVVVFGHTHVAKWRALDDGWYLNTGTWCHTIRLSDAFYSPAAPSELVIPEMKQFVEDLARNRTEPWCRLDTMCAHVVVAGESADAELCEVAADGTFKPVKRPHGP